jgi:hypothetical protein
MANDQSKKTKSGAAVRKDDRTTKKVEKSDSAETKTRQHVMSKGTASSGPIVAAQIHASPDVKEAWGIPMIEALNLLARLLERSSPQLVSTLRNCRRNILKWVKSTSYEVVDTIVILLDAFLSHELSKHVLKAIDVLPKIELLL